MKKNLTIPMILMTLILSLLPVSLAAEITDSSCIVTLHKQPKQTKEHNQELDQDGQRAPARPIYCNISKDNGVEISVLDCEIISYEIWDLEGNYCIASFSEEAEFVEFVFSMTSNFTIKIITDDFYLFGNVYCESF